MADSEIMAQNRIFNTLFDRSQIQAFKRLLCQLVTNLTTDTIAGFLFCGLQ